MKKHLLIIVALCGAYISTTAQLTVSSDGNATLTKKMGIGATPDSQSSLYVYKHSYNSTQPYDGIKSYILTPIGMPVSNSFAIHGFTDASAFTGCGNNNNIAKQMCGVVGEVSINTSIAQATFCAGVAGIANNCSTYGGIGVFGAIKQGYAMPAWSLGSYAGYFQGPVKVTSTLTASSISTTSDARLKQNIEYLEQSDVQAALLQLRPISYYFKHDADSNLCLFDANTKAMEMQHYGLVAQEVKQILPNLVYENADSYLSVNYIELIPLLIQAVKQQQTQIDELQSMLSAQTQNNIKHNMPAAQANGAGLLQNTPNPFSQNTKIGYYLPTDTREAAIRVYDMSGAEIAVYPIVSFGQGELTINGGTFRAGMYLYSLIADGQLIDTKQMILTK